MEKKAVGRSVFISACKKSSVGVLREQSEQYPIFPSYKEDKMADNYDGMAVGVFELDNLVACFVALDERREKPTEKWSLCKNARQCFRCKCSYGSGIGDCEAPW